jgi:YHS domain-containing protein
LLDVDSVPVALFFDSTGAPAWQTARFTTAQVTRGLSAIVAPAEYTDPVCGMKVTAASAAGTINYEGRPYYFCSAACRTAFAREPQKYLNRQ